MIEDISITRRRLLKVGGAAAAAVSIPGLAMPARAAAAGGWLDYATYTDRIGEAFHMQLENGKRFGLKLLSVTGDEKAFVLHFHPTSTVEHAQATREFTHTVLGRTQLFVVPLKVPKQSLKYVVAVNRSH